MSFNTKIFLLLKLFCLQAADLKIGVYVVSVGSVDVRWDNCDQVHNLIKGVEDMFMMSLTGKTMYSDQFTVAVNGKQTRWRLKMYPNGRKPVDQGYVTLFLKDSGRLDASVITES